MAKTYFEYTGDGIRTVYPAAFALGYLQTSDVYVYVGDDYTNQVDYTWQDSTTIEIGAPIAVGSKLTLRRVVDRSQLQNDYKSGAALEENNLNDSFRQSLMIGEEAEDGLSTPAGSVVITPLNMNDNEVENLADATQAQSAVTLAQLQAIQVSPLGVTIGPAPGQLQRGSDVRVDTIADMRTSEPTVDGQQLSLLGHTTAGLGGGNFYYDASDSTSADNGGTIVVTVGGKRWKRIDVLGSTPEWFGFTPTSNLASNTTAFQAYVDAVDVVTLKEDQVYLIDTLTLRSNLTIQGSPTSKIKCQNTINPVSLSNIRLLNVELEYGEDTPNGLTLLQLTTCSNVWIDRCIFNGLGYNGATPLATGANIGIQATGCSNVKITNNDIGNFKNNWGVNLINCENVDVTRNYIHHTGRAGISVDNENTGVRLIDNELFLCKTNHISSAAYDGCIDLYGPNNSQVTVHGNRIRAGGGTAALGSGQPAKCTGIRVHGSFNVDVTNNIIETGAGTHTVFGVQARDGINPSGVNMHDNITVVTGPVNYGLRLLVCSNLKFEGNISRAEAADGLYTNNLIELRNSGENISIIDNVFSGFAGGVSTVDGVAGIVINNSATLFSNVVISDNVIPSDAAGIFLNRCDMFIVSGNIIEYDQPASGINASATASNGIISNNCVKRPSNPTINVDAGATNVTESGNILVVGPVP